MGRLRVYASAAERQRAYRERMEAGSNPASPVNVKARRPPSRPARLTRLTAEVQALAFEYEGWLEAVPETLRDTEQATRLTDTVEQLMAAADILADIHPPRGFGRD